MVDITKILRRFLCPLVICVLLFGGDCASAEEEIGQNHQQKGPTSFTVKSRDHEKEDLFSQAQLVLHARLTSGGESITQGLVWRVYTSAIGVDNKLPLIATSEGGSASFNLKAGSYLVHVSFGRATFAQRVDLENGQTLTKNFVLDAGGVIFDATLLNGAINKKDLLFTLYEDAKENDDTGVILSNIKPQSIVRLKAGRYHVVSYYGSINAVVRSDIQVDAGKITEVSLEHQAAQVILKLVRQKGGEALADTSWSITNDSGDIIYETAGAYVSLVLVEGDYIAIAKNKDKIYQKTFSVSSGHDKDVSVVADTQNMQKIENTVD
ncbi:carboxypeptidase regulatory-like domain-containing protein [Bartonella sp. CB178]|uniref:carboxypeptidase regulatory-like domain-containing protein n=1 Tax=Bartonella sp. CB178 TaxID=3112255 RepID=UPI00300DD53B